MTASLPIQVAIPSLSLSEADLISVLESALYPGAKPESIKLVIAYCRAAQLDPMLKPVHIVPMKVKQKKQDGQGFNYVWRDVIMPGIELYRIRASRTGEYVGMDKAEWGPNVTEKLGAVTVTYPEWCEVTVYRLVGGQRCPFNSGRVRWKETYANKGYDEDGGRNDAPNAMWDKREYGQLEKCAEALALRRAFPELGAAPTAEEMQGRIIDVDPTPAPPLVAGPKAKSEPKGGGAPSPDAGGGRGGGPERPAPAAEAEKKAEGPLLKPSQSNVIRNRLDGAGLTTVDLEAAFPGKCIEPKPGRELFLAAEANDVLDWIQKSAKA